MNSWRAIAGLGATLLLAWGVVAQAADRSRVEEASFVSIGGIEQWVTIRGADRRNPVLLILHGGPAEVQSPLISIYEPFERDFVVVQWDQRGAGKTLGRTADLRQETSLELLTKDGIELTQYLQRHLRAHKVILLGHSWGSYLGVHIVQQRPELYRAFVGTGQVNNWRDTVTVQYRYALQRARAQPNPEAVAALEALGVPKPDTLEQYGLMRRWLNAYLAPSDLQWLPRQDELVRNAPALSDADRKAYGTGFQNSWPGLGPVVLSMDLPALGYDFKLPFFVIQGRDDQITPTVLAQQYFAQIRAPEKRMTLIDGAGHFAAMTHTQQFAADLRDDLRIRAR